MLAWIREMQPTAIDASRNAAPLRRRVLRVVAIGIAAGFLLAYLGALGTGAAPFIERLFYWLAVILPGSLLGLMIASAVQGVGFLANARWPRVGVVALVVSIPHTFLVIVASAIFFGTSDITLDLVLNFWIAVLVLSLALSAISSISDPPLETNEGQHWDEAGSQNTAPNDEVPPLKDESQLPAIPDLIAEKLPVPLGKAGLIAIQSEDHYLRIHTDMGSDLVLMRMSDACALLFGVDGERVHRSWWVAKAAVTGREIDGSRMALLLQNGERASVSRKMQPVMRTERW